MISLTARLILPIYVLCSAVLAAALLLGATIPTPTHVSLMTHSSCALPCLYGITPGLTSRDQALQAFARSGLSYSYVNPGLPANMMQKYTSNGPLLALIDLGTQDGENVRSILLYQMMQGHDLGALSDFLLAGYQPTTVFSRCQSQRSMILTFTNPPMFLEFVPDERFIPDMPVTLVAVTDNDNSLIQSIDGLDCAARSHWSGFAVAWKYDALQR